MGTRITKQSTAFRRVFKETGVIKTAALAAGYSETTAHTGIRGLPKTHQRFILRQRAEMDKYMVLGASISPEQQENTVRGRLLHNAVTGKDDGVGSCKLLGQDKRVNMFAADSQIGVIVIGNLPQDAESTPVIDVKPE